MKFHHTLQGRLTALLFVLGVLLIAVSHFQHLSRDLWLRREAVRAQAYAMGTRISGLAQHSFWRGQFRTVDLEISYASVVPELALGVICDGNGIIRNTTLQRWRGLSIDVTPLAYAIPVVKRVRETMSGEVEEELSKNRLLAAFPFNDGRNNHSTGLVLLDFDLRAPLAAARSAALNDTISQGLALLATCLLLWLVLHLIVTSRLNMLVMQTASAGGTSALVPVLTGRDEMATLSRAFADAFERLRDSELQFRQFAESVRDVLWIAPEDQSRAPLVNSAYRPVWLEDTSVLKKKRWSWLRRVAADDRDKVMHFLASLRNGTEKGEVEFRLAMPDGGTRWVQCRGFRLQTSAGHGAGAGGIAVDVTERRDIAKRLVEAAERERRRIGMDLHDDVCQRLAAAQLKCGVLEAMLKKEKSPHVQLTGAIVNEISIATDIARSFAKGMAPAALNVGDFGPALDLLVQQTQKAFDVKCTAQSSIPDDTMSEEVAAHVFRMAQELAVNAAKHGRGHWVRIRCFMIPGTLTSTMRLEVSNDGIHFDPSMTAGAGMGLHLVKQRADVLGATVSFHPRPEPDGGTMVFCDIPLPHQEF